MFDYTPMPENFMKDSTLQLMIIIAFVLVLLFWVLFMFVHPLFGIPAVITNITQFLLMQEASYRKGKKSNAI